MKIFGLFFYAGVGYFASAIPLFFIEYFHLTPLLGNILFYINAISKAILLVAPFLIARVYREGSWVKLPFIWLSLTTWVKLIYPIIGFYLSRNLYSTNSAEIVNLYSLLIWLYTSGLLAGIGGCFMVMSERIRKEFLRMGWIAIACIFLSIVGSFLPFSGVTKYIASSICYLPLVLTLHTVWKNDLRTADLEAEVAIIGQPEKQNAI